MNEQFCLQHQTLKLQWKE